MAGDIDELYYFVALGVAASDVEVPVDSFEGSTEDGFDVAGRGSAAVGALTVAVLG